MIKSNPKIKQGQRNRLPIVKNCRVGGGDLGPNRRRTRRIALPEPTKREPEQGRAAPPSAKAPGVAIGILLTAAFLWQVVAFLVFIVEPMFAKRFADFQELTPVHSDWSARNAWWIAPVGLAVALVCCIAGRSRRIGFALLILVPVSLIVLIVLGIYLPYAELMDALGSKSPEL